MRAKSGRPGGRFTGTRKKVGEQVEVHSLPLDPSTGLPIADSVVYCVPGPDRYRPQIDLIRPVSPSFSMRGKCTLPSFRSEGNEDAALAPQGLNLARQTNSQWPKAASASMGCGSRETAKRLYSGGKGSPENIYSPGPAAYLVPGDTGRQPVSGKTVVAGSQARHHAPQYTFGLSLGSVFDSARRSSSMAERTRASPMPHLCREEKWLSTFGEQVRNPSEEPRPMEPWHPHHMFTADSLCTSGVSSFDSLPPPPPACLPGPASHAPLAPQFPLYCTPWFHFIPLCTRLMLAIIDTETALMTPHTSRADMPYI